jgi:hypothetical protein
MWLSTEHCHILNGMGGCTILSVRYSPVGADNVHLQIVVTDALPYVIHRAPNERPKCNCEWVPTRYRESSADANHVLFSYPAVYVAVRVQFTEGWKSNAAS